MKKKFKAQILVSGLLNLTVLAETIQLGGDPEVRTAGWFEMAGEAV
ncbi:hypothetical protein P4B35_01465 [Pontiellaceae bacterium B12227]|nr:hypothetical protein [Pontiellaceae bacterium B12227]